MDANEITCPKCGHPNSYISEGCVKCGIIFSKYLKLQEKRRENESTHVDDTVEKSKVEENPVIKSAEKTEPAALESISADNTAQTMAETSASEPEVQSTKETEPEKSQAQSVEDISMDEIELPQEASAEPLENQMQTNPETPLAAKEEQEISISPEEKSEPTATADVRPTQRETQATDQLAVQKNGEQVTQEPLGEPIPEPVAAETAPVTEEVLELVEPVEVEKTDKPETEAKPEETQPQGARDTATSKDEEIANDDTISAPREENLKVAPTEIEQPAKAEQEIVLEEVAEPVQVEASSIKSEEQAREDLLKKQKAALVAAETAKKEKETQANVWALKKKKLAQAKLEGLKKQKVAQVKALKKQKDELAKQKALKKQKASQAKAEALKKQKEAQSLVETSVQESQTMEKGSSEIRQTMMSKDIDSKLKIMALLKKYEGKTIGINYDNSAEIKEAQLVEANNEFFSVSVKDTKLQYSYPLQTLLSLIEGEDGVEAGEAESKTKFTAVIKVYPLVLF
jgi:hypothetical protein